MKSILSKRTAIRFVGWGIGSMPLQIMLYAKFYFVRYATDVVGIGPATVGTLVLMAKLMDAVADPVIGHLSDRTRTRIGRRRPYLLAGSLLSGVSVGLLFSLRYLAMTESIWLIALAVLLLYSVSYSVFAVPYFAMAVEITSGYHERSTLMMFRSLGSAVGQLVGGAGAGFLLAALAGGAAGHLGLGWILAGCIVITGLTSFFMTAGAPFSDAPSHYSVSLREQLRTASENRELVTLLGVKTSFFLALYAFNGVLLFLFGRVLHLDDRAFGLSAAASAMAGLLAPPLWLFVSRALDKKLTTYLAATLWIGALGSWAFAEPSPGSGSIMLRGFLTGTGSCGVLMLVASMMTDVIDLDRRRTGQAREGVLAALFALVEKVTNAAAAGMVGFALALGGYQPKLAPGVDQPDSAILAIQVMAFGAPLLLVAVGCLLLSRYRLTGEGTDAPPSSAAAKVAQ